MLQKDSKYKLGPEKYGASFLKNTASQNGLSKSYGWKLSKNSKYFNALEKTEYFRAAIEILCADQSALNENQWRNVWSPKTTILFFRQFCRVRVKGGALKAFVCIGGKQNSYRSPANEINSQRTERNWQNFVNKFALMPNWKFLYGSVRNRSSSFLDTKMWYTCLTFIVTNGLL